MNIIKTILLGCYICMLASCTDEYTGRHWVTYIPPDKRFSIEMPQGYKTGSFSSFEDGLGAHTTHDIWWRIPTYRIPEFDIKLIALSYCDLPDKSWNGNEDKILKKCADCFVEKWNEYGKVSIEDFVKDGHKGKKLTCKINNKNQAAYFWKYIVNRRLYTFEASVYNGYNDSTETNRVFNSFRLSK